MYIHWAMEYNSKAKRQGRNMAKSTRDINYIWTRKAAVDTRRQEKSPEKQ